MEKEARERLLREIEEAQKRVSQNSIAWHGTEKQIYLFPCFLNREIRPETQKVQTFRLAEFHAQKLSGRSA